MADQKTSALPELATTPASDDVVYILDVSEPDATKSKRITIGNLLYTEGAKVYHSANQSIPDNTNITLAFNTEVFDTNTIHDPITNNSRLTCKTAGKYLVVGKAEWSPNTSGSRKVYIKKNGDTETIITVGTSPVGDYTDTMTVVILDLAVNDYVELQVRQNSGGDLSVDCVYKYNTYFLMQRMG